MIDINKLKEHLGTHRFVKIWKQNGEVFQFNG